MPTHTLSNEGMSSRDFLKKNPKPKKTRQDKVSVLENNYYLSLSEDFWHLFQFYFEQVQKTIDFHFPLPLGCGNERVKGGDLERRAWFCTQSRSAATAGGRETHSKAAAAELGLMLKAIWRARRKGGKGVGFAALLICTHTHTRFLSIKYNPSSRHWCLSRRTQKAVRSLPSPWKIADNIQCLPR